MNILANLLLSLFIFFALPSLSFADCLLKMGYKEGGKLPLIAKQPDNSGAYLDLFSKAAESIGCRLVVVRLPKKRLHSKLKTGQLDFYPGASFSEKRAIYLYYIENGFTTAQYGITSINIPEISNFQQVKELDLLWLLELGGSKVELTDSIGVRSKTFQAVDIEKMRRLIYKGRNVFYVADKELIDYYLKSKGLSTLTEIGLKVHRHCCGGDAPMYMGFSRFSAHFTEIANPEYDQNKPLNPGNSPTIVGSGSVAYRLGQALRKMKDSGETADIYKTYF